MTTPKQGNPPQDRFTVYFADGEVFTFSWRSVYASLHPGEGEGALDAFRSTFGDFIAIVHHTAATVADRELYRR